MLRLRNELNGNSELISPRSVGPHNNSISFVPFINERDSLGRLIGITPKRYDLKRDLMPRGGGSKKQLLSKIYQDSQTQESIHIESKMDDLESPSGMDFWRSEEILPRIKRSELSLGELKINKKPIKARAQNKDINSARDLPERTRIPPIGFYDVSSSLQLTKQKQRVAIIFEEHKKNRPTELEVIKESKDSKGDRSQNSNMTKSNSGSNPIYQIKSERYMRPIDNKANKGIAYKDSAASFVDKRSYFKRIKSREDEDMYSKYQQSMNHKFNEMREKLNMLKGSINQE